MTNNTRTRNIRALSGTSGSTRSLRSVTDHDAAAKARTESEDKLWKALHAYPNSTSTDLASAAKIGKSTAGKILAKWEKDTSVTRTPRIVQGGGRVADLWAITSTAHTVYAPTNDTPGPISAENSGSEEGVASVDNTQPAATVPDSPAAGADADDEEQLPEASPGDGTTDIPKVDIAGTEPSIQPTVPASDSLTDSGTASERGEGDGKKARLAPGALRGMIEDYLRAHPGQDWGPATIAKALGGRSSGAVSNALDKLVAEGVVVKTKGSPRRFALASAQ